MKYLSVCSGIEAATVAWHHLGWEPVGFSEIEKFPSQVLQHHYPNVPNLGDMTKFKEWNIERPALLVGGTPCQSFSVAGLRKGLEDPRGNLALVYIGILDHYRPTWFVWENVPGVLSSAGGRDFGSFLGAVAQLRYGFAYRVLDAQYWGVAQRRKRVFVVGYLGDWRPAAAVLFESKSLSRDIAPSRQKGETTAEGFAPSVANCLTRRMHKGVNSTLDEGQTTIVQPTFVQPIPLNTMTLQGRPSDDGRMDSGVGQPGDPCPTITKAHSHAVAQPISALCARNGQSISVQDADQGHLLPHSMAVRRLTPVECERLQGFPDNYTNIRSDCPDGPRYKALGNSMAVPVMRWIGERIAL